MLATATLMLVMVAPAQKNEAEELFRKMEDKVHKAKSIQYESETVVEGPEKMSMVVKATLAEGNKANMSVTAEVDGKKVGVQGVSDGKKSRRKHGNEPVKMEETPKNMNIALSSTLTRLGITGMAATRDSKEEDPLKADKFDKDKFIPLSDFKMGAKEKVGDIETQIVEYSIRLRKDSPAIPVKVWIDPKTNLPVKRAYETSDRGKPSKVTETIKTLKLDEKVDEKLFELPRD